MNTRPNQPQRHKLPHGILIALFICIFLSISQTGRAQALESIGSRSFILTATAGKTPLATTGKAMLIFDDAGTNHVIYGMTANYTNSLGSCEYVKSNASVGVLTMTNSNFGVAVTTLKFTTATSGTYTLKVVGSSSFQNGKFVIYNGSAPNQVTNSVYDMVVTSGTAPFSKTGHFRFHFHEEGVYTIKNIAGAKDSSGTNVYVRQNVASGFFNFQDSLLGTCYATMMFSNSLGGFFLFHKDVGAGVQNGTFHRVVPPAIKTSPTHMGVANNGKATLTVVATGDGPFTYQWYFAGNPIVGATNKSLALTGINSSKVGSYYVAVSNDGGTANSAIANVVLGFPTTRVLAPAVITKPLQSYTVNSNAASLVLTVGATGSLLKYQWQLNSTNIPNATNAFIVRSNLSGIHAGVYNVIVTNVVSSASSAMLLTVTNSPLDINHDGQTDFLLRSTNGQFIQWFGNGVNFLKNVVLTNAVDPKWRFAALNDFDNDGEKDLLLQYTNGALSVIKMSGTNMVGSYSLDNGTIVTPDWRIVSMTDFDGNGTKDLMGQNYTNGLVGVWLMEGTNFMSSTPTIIYAYNELTHELLPIGGTNFTVIGTGNFHLQGNQPSPDILTQDKDGFLLIWFMNGTNFADGEGCLGGGYANAFVNGNQVFVSPGAAWKASIVADYNYNGVADIIFQNSAGKLQFWGMNGATVIQSGYLRGGAVINKTWTLIGPR